MIGQVRYKFTSEDETPNIFTDMLTNGVITEGSALTKLAIQAPLGTQVKINDKTIIIGYTKIYQVPDNIIVKSLSFVNDGDIRHILIDYEVN